MAQRQRCKARIGPSILLIDDDVELCVLIGEYLSQRGYRVNAVQDGRSGLAGALRGGHDLIILDVMLPILDGFEVLCQLRRRKAVPVIILTARTAQEDRITGLEAGADDYLPKPFGAGELLARIRAVLRRTGHLTVQPEIIEAAGLRLHGSTRQVWQEGLPVALTSIEFDILDLLVRSAGRIVSRDELVAVLYQRESSSYDRSVDVHVSHLRKKLERTGHVLIRTVRGEGYLFSKE